MNTKLASWTGFTSVSDCVVCKEIDKPTKEYVYENKFFYLCDDCVEKVEVKENGSISKNE